jgi:hypothetical protein
MKRLKVLLLRLTVMSEKLPVQIGAQWRLQGFVHIRLILPYMERLKCFQRKIL